LQERERKINGLTGKLSGRETACQVVYDGEKKGRHPFCICSPGVFHGMLFVRPTVITRVKERQHLNLREEGEASTLFSSSSSGAFASHKRCLIKRGAHSQLPVNFS